MDQDDDSSANWLYDRCSTSRTTMKTPLSAIQLSIKVMRFIKSIDKYSTEMSQLELYAMLKNECKAEARDISFLAEISERAIDLRHDDTLSLAALWEIAVSRGDSDRPASDEIGDVATATDCATEDGDIVVIGGDSAHEEGGIATDVPASSAIAQAAEEEKLAECTSATGNDNDAINFDELHCFQLRTRVLGLNMPTFKDLWNYLQAAGWTYSSGIYHIPKGGGMIMKYGTEGVAKKIYKHFNLDNNESHRSTGGEEDECDDSEEGPDTFRNPNDLVDYLDEYCMPDYRATPAEIQLERVASSSKSKAYKRRNIRLRFELLEVAYRERVHKSKLAQEEEGGNNDAGMKSKYGHDHRPCEVCLKGAKHLHPRVACRACGLVVHTHCYGLLDHGEEEKDAANIGNRSSARKGPEVDEKGLFTCDVCTIYNLKKKQHYWNATQSSGWRVHEHPNATCPLCNRKDIRGAMVKIVVEEAARGTGVSSRRSAESSESWVHLFCINSLPSRTIVSGSIRSSSNAAHQIQNALDRAAERVRETESMRETTIRCVTCEKSKGDIVECKGKCGTFFHRLCLQIDCLEAKVGWNTKKEHLCLSCRNIYGGEPCPDQNDDVALPLTRSSKTNACQNKSTKVNARQGEVAEEVDQYFERKKPGKKSLKSEDLRSVLVVPSQQDCIAEVETLHRQSNVDQAFDEYEAQYQEQFYEWSFSMATNQSILLYGLGSKTSVLTSFGEYLAQEGDVVSLNGYDPNIDLNQFFGYMEQLFIDGSEPNAPAGKNVSMRDSKKGLVKRASFIAKTFASTRSRPLFILIHNIDGVGLRNCYVQEAVATLTANSQKDGSPLVRVVASVDNVNAAMVLWPPQVEHKFDWAWKKVHTHRPYFEEVRSMPHTESSKKVKKRKGSYNVGSGSAALKVLAYISPKHTEVLQVLATLQLSSSPNSVSYDTFREECEKKMLISSDLSLRNILKELIDHHIVGLERDKKNNELVFVPSTVPIHDILDFKLNQPAN